MLGTGFDHLVALYGETVARAVQPQLDALLTRWRDRLPPPAASAAVGAAPLALNERDALLITYADQVRAPDRSPLRALGSFADAHLRDVVSGLHLLPFYPSTSDDGFAVQDYYAVDPAVGTWDDVRALGTRFALMFDGVFNHASAQSESFRKFLADDPAYRDFFITVTGDPDLSAVIRPRALPLLTEFPSATGPRKIWTTFSADQVDLNFANPTVLLAVLDALLFYVSQGARLVRLDAIAFLWKQIGTTSLHLPQTHRIIQLMRTVVDTLAPGTLLITETNVPHRDNVSYFGDGTHEAHLVYNFALPPLVLHTFATGDATKLTLWARSLELPSDRVAFFNFLASHDGIGLNPARGILAPGEIDALVDRAGRHGGFVSYKHQPDGSQIPYEMNLNFFDALSSPSGGEPIDVQISRMLCAHAIQLALAGLPGIYFHSLFGSRGDRHGAEASGIPRRINREKLTLAALERDLSDPISLRARVFAGLKELLAARRSSAAFHPTAPQEIVTDDPRLFVVRRTSPDGRETVLCLHNISATPVETRLRYRHLIRHAGENRIFRVLHGPEESVVRNALFLRVSLPPYTATWARLGSM